MDPVKLYFLLKMGIIQPAMLVYQSFCFLPSPQTLLPAMKKPPWPPQAIYVMAVYVTQAATAYRLELPDGGVYAEQIARWWGSMSLGSKRFRGAWVFLEHKKSMHVFLNHKGSFFHLFFKWCLLTVVWFFYLGGEVVVLFFSPKGMFFVKWKDTGRCRCRELIYKSTILAGSAVSSASLSLSKKTVWRVRYGGTILRSATIFKLPSWKIWGHKVCSPCSRALLEVLILGPQKVPFQLLRGVSCFLDETNIYTVTKNPNDLL